MVGIKFALFFFSIFVFWNSAIIAKQCNQQRINHIALIRDLLNADRPPNSCLSYGEEDIAGIDNDNEYTNYYKFRRHMVCYATPHYADINNYFKKVFVYAEILEKDFKNGEKTRRNVDIFWRKYKAVCTEDELGHILPKEYGGQGTEFNIFVQSKDLNRRLYQTATNQIGDFLKAGPNNRYVIFKMGFLYEDDGKLRPSDYFYMFEFYENNAIVETKLGYFENSNYVELEYETCANGNDKLHFVEPNDKYFDVRSCQPVASPSRKYGRQPFNV